MSDQRLLFCVGATKAGTSWLYRALHDHPGAALKSVKELHYWDTTDAAARDRQVAACRGKLEQFRRQAAEAEAAGRDWQVRNMARRIDDMEGLIRVLGADRADDRAYTDWLGQGADESLTADMTPGYAILPDETLTQMAARVPGALWVYLVRDPLARLWSHVRMQAERQRQSHEAVEDKANGILWRILNKGHETHILQRGDYPQAVARLRRIVPAPQLRIEFCERLFRTEGWTAMCRFLGLEPTAVDGANRVHEGPKATMRPDLERQALGFLKTHYEWAAREMGPLPQNWQHNLARAKA